MTELATDGLQDLCSGNIRTAGNNLQNAGVVLVQLGVGVDVKITPWRWHCGAARSWGSGCGLLNSNIYGIRHCASTLQKHMTNINGGDYRCYNHLSFPWSSFSYFNLH